MKRHLSLLLILSIFFGDINWRKAQASMLPWLIALGSLGWLWYNKSKEKTATAEANKKKQELQNELDDLKSKIDSMNQPAPYITNRDLDGPPSPTPPIAAHASTQVQSHTEVPAVPPMSANEGVAKNLLIAMSEYTHVKIKDLASRGGTEPDTVSRKTLPDPNNPYSGQTARAVNAHTFWGLKKAGCKMDSISGNSELIQDPSEWQQFFNDPDRKDLWHKFEASVGKPTTEFLSNFAAKLPSGSVIVYDCSAQEASTMPVVEVIGQTVPNTTTQSSSLLLGWRANTTESSFMSQYRCPKILGVYTPTSDKCQN